MGRECWQCRMWESFAERADRAGGGLCRAYAPSKLNGEHGIWPRTPGDAWCGEFQVRASVPSMVTLECYQAAQAQIRDLQAQVASMVSEHTHLLTLERVGELARGTEKLEKELADARAELERMKQVELAGV